MKILHFRGRNCFSTKMNAVPVVIWFLLLNSGFLSVFSISIHSHIHNKERVEDGAHSPKSKDIRDQKSDSEMIHETIIGSAKEAEEYDHLHPEEAKKRLRLLLSKIDTNDDKFIDPEELYAWIMKSFRKLSEEECDETFEEADANKDFKISWKEHLYDSFGEEDDFDEEHADDQLLIKADKRVFQSADLDKDQFLDKIEYRRLCSPENFADMLPILIQNTLDEKDLNNDGSIDFEEYIGDKDRMNEQAFIISEKETFKSNYDKNDDGRLDRDEILSWIIPNSSQIAVEETKHLMAAADDNHDLLLSYDEVIDNHDVFVGSEVTDFGEHLHNIHAIMDEL